MALEVRQEGEGRLEGVVLPVGLDHNPLVGRHAVLGQEAVEVVQGGAIHRAGHDQQLAAAGHIVGEHIPLLPGDVAGGGVDEEAGGVLRNGVHGQQGEVVQLHVRLLQLILEGGGQLALAVALQPVELGLLGVDHIIDGRSSLYLGIGRDGLTNDGACRHLFRGFLRYRSGNQAQIGQHLLSDLFPFACNIRNRYRIGQCRACAGDHADHSPFLCLIRAVADDLAGLYRIAALVLHIHDKAFALQKRFGRLRCKGIQAQGG